LVCYWKDLQELVKLYLLKLLLVKLVYHSSQFLVLTSLKCSSVLVLVVCVTYLKMLKRTHHLLSLSMKLMQYDVVVLPEWPVDMMKWYKDLCKSHLNCCYSNDMNV